MPARDAAPTLRVSVCILDSSFLILLVNIEGYLYDRKRNNLFQAGIFHFIVVLKQKPTGFDIYG
jgi:hypothetical protein